MISTVRAKDHFHFKTIPFTHNWILLSCWWHLPYSDLILAPCLTHLLLADCVQHLSMNQKQIMWPERDEHVEDYGRAYFLSISGFQLKNNNNEKGPQKSTDFCLKSETDHALVNIY